MDLIAAIATGAAASAIGIVRLSGDGCFAVCDQVFRPPDGAPVSARPPRVMVYGDVLDGDGAVLDRALCVRFPGPGSYTGEDCAELHCHGSPVVLRVLLGRLFALGARQARAGEFTKRAFLNGRMDLTEAEAVIDLIDAETADAAKNAAGQLSGALRRRLEPVQDALLDVTARFYAVVDYPDEDIADVQPQQIQAALASSRETLSRLLDTCRRGRVLKGGVRTALVGRPNVGKSSLLNALTGCERCIVTDVPGTTRDTVEETAVVRGTLLRLIDTAGLRDTEDTVEKLGVERSRRAAEGADLAIAVLDGTAGLTPADRESIALARACPHWILAVSKDDLLSPRSSPVLQLSPDGRMPDALVRVSSVAPGGLLPLEEAIAQLFPSGSAEETGSLLTDARQEDAVGRSLAAVCRAEEALCTGMTPDAILTDAEEALCAIGELTGRSAREDLVERIFSRFCVGK